VNCRKFFIVSAECNPSWKEPVVRTILNIDNDAQSMILAGDAPVNSRVQL
jgi:hypothetical protein